MALCLAISKPGVFEQDRVGAWASGKGKVGLQRYTVFRRKQGNLMKAVFVCLFVCLFVSQKFILFRRDATEMSAREAAARVVVSAARLVIRLESWSSWST